MKKLTYDEALELGYYGNYFSLYRKLIKEQDKNNTTESERIINKLLNYRMEIRNITGDYLKTQERWDARKEKRKLQSLIIDSQSNNKKKRL